MESVSFTAQIVTGHNAKVRELKRKRISDFRPRLHKSFIRPHRNTGDTSGELQDFRAVTILLLSRGGSAYIFKTFQWIGNQMYWIGPEGPRRRQPPKIPAGNCFWG